MEGEEGEKEKEEKELMEAPFLLGFSTRFCSKVETMTRLRYVLFSSRSRATPVRQWFALFFSTHRLTVWLLRDNRSNTGIGVMECFGTGCTACIGTESVTRRLCCCM